MNEHKRELKEIQKYIRNLSKEDMKPIESLLEKVSIGTIISDVGRRYVSEIVNGESSPAYICIYKILFNISIMINYDKLIDGIITYHELIVKLTNNDEHIQTVLSAVDKDKMLPTQVVLFVILILK